VARVKALPQDYQIVYKEIQKYLFKVGPVELTDGTGLLSGIIDLFEEGAALGKGVLEVKPGLVYDNQRRIQRHPNYCHRFTSFPPN